MSVRTTTQHKVAEPIAVNWQNVSPQKWFHHLEQLSQSYIAPEDRLYWMSSMRDWAAHNISFRAEKTRYRDDSWDNETLVPVLAAMNEIAYSLCDWVLIIQLNQYVRAIERQLDTQQIEVETLQLAVAHWQLGQFAEAKQVLAAMTEPGGQTPMSLFYQQVDNDQSRLPFSSQDLCAGDITLTPLEEQHLSSFSWVYNDPQIAKLCNLPDFDNDEQWFDWLEQEQSNHDKMVFAVLHNKWGFVGSVSIEVHDGAGYFYYWLGQDFQGGGFGPKAVLLMLTLAEKYFDMQCCYAKVFEYNLPSQKAMSKMGFKPLPFKLAPPNQSQLYFYRGAEKSTQDQQQELIELMRYTDVDNHLVV